MTLPLREYGGMCVLGCHNNWRISVDIYCPGARDVKSICNEKQRTVILGKINFFFLNINSTPTNNLRLGLCYGAESPWVEE